MKIRIKRANTVDAYLSARFSLTSHIADYIDELRQHAQWYN
jgi:hypothetical protein